MNNLRSSVTSMCLALFVAACSSGQSNSLSENGGSAGNQNGGSGGNQNGGSGGNQNGGSSGNQNGGSSGNQNGGAGGNPGGAGGSQSDGTGGNQSGGAGGNPGGAGGSQGGAGGGTGRGGSGGSQGGAGGGTAGVGAGGGTAGVGAGGNPGGAGGSQNGGTTGTVGGTGGQAVPDNPPPAEDFTDKVGSASVDMVYIPGGTFTLGCETSSCDADTSPVENITVSTYHIMKTEVSRAMWSAVGLTEGTWYDCMAFACELGKQTGRAYRIMTEAEFEYAAKKYLSKLSQIDGSEEWAFNSWETKYSCKPGDVDPLGPTPGSHMQKTRRDKANGDHITGRLIRSIDGIGPKCRLTISDKTDYPPGCPPSCSITPVVPTDEPENSYRDPRWVTGDNAKWKKGASGIGNFDLQTWDDGTARMNGKDGQWFTSNNIALVFVPSSGSSVKYPYMFLDADQGSVISDAGFMSGFIGRFERTSVTGVTKPTISGLKSGAELAAAAGDDYKMVDMEHIPESAKKQDPRLIDTTSDCWFQNNINAGGTHNYRKDIDKDEFRFAVIDKGQVVMLANGKWWTVNNTFLHIEHSDGYVAEYLYAISSDGYFFHDSYMAYERADFRLFQKYDNATGNFPPTCINDSCSQELPKGAASSVYSKQGDTGKSTFVPARCPADGCK
jgi:hypothetical protein